MARRDVCELLSVVGTPRESDWDVRGIAEDATCEIRRLRCRISELTSDICFLREELASDRGYAVAWTCFYSAAMIASFMLGFSLRNF